MTIKKEGYKTINPEEFEKYQDRIVTKAEVALQEGDDLEIRKIEIVHGEPSSPILEERIEVRTGKYVGGIGKITTFKRVV